MIVTDSNSKALCIPGVAGWVDYRMVSTLLTNLLRHFIGEPWHVSEHSLNTNPFIPIFKVQEVWDP
jgi:hypothetical protein